MSYAHVKYGSSYTVPNEDQTNGISSLRKRGICTRTLSGMPYPAMVRRGSVGSASACCKAGPSSILGSAPQGGSPHWANKRWRFGERPQRMATDKCIEWMWLYECMYVCYKIWKINKKSGIMPPNIYPAIPSQNFSANSFYLSFLFFWFKHQIKLKMPKHENLSSSFLHSVIPSVQVIWDWNKKTFFY